MDDFVPIGTLGERMVAIMRPMELKDKIKFQGLVFFLITEHLERGFNLTKVEFDVMVQWALTELDKNTGWN